MVCTPLQPLKIESFSSEDWVWRPESHNSKITLQNLAPSTTWVWRWTRPQESPDALHLSCSRRQRTWWEDFEFVLNSNILRIGRTCFAPILKDSFPSRTGLWKDYSYSNLSRTKFSSRMSMSSTARRSTSKGRKPSPVKFSSAVSSPNWPTTNSKSFSASTEKSQSSKWSLTRRLKCEKGSGLSRLTRKTLWESCCLWRKWPSGSTPLISGRQRRSRISQEVDIHKWALVINCTSGAH